MDYIKKGLEKQFKEQCNKNKDAYGKSVIDTAKVIMERLMDKMATPKSAWYYGLKQFPHTHSIMSAAYVAITIAQYSPRGDEFKRWCKKDDVVNVNWK